VECIFNLRSDTDRPLIILDDIFIGCTALIDTGALIPVWTKEVDLLQAMGAVLEKKDVEFGGFGGKAKGDLYKLTLKLGCFIYPDMPIVACYDDKIPGFFLFTATMFKKTTYIIDDIRKTFTLTTNDNQVCRNLKVQDSDGHLSVLYTTK